MKKLTEKQIHNLNVAKLNGVQNVFLPIRKCFSTWYVKMFSVDELLATGFLPSYWYRDSGITETKALNMKAERLLNW